MMFLNYLKRVFTINRRMSKGEFWKYTIIFPIFLFFMILFFRYEVFDVYISTSLSDNAIDEIFGTFLIFLIFFYFLILVFTTIQRTRDLNISTFISLITLFIPFANFFMILSILFKRGTIGKNKYGADPVFLLEIERKRKLRDKRVKNKLNRNKLNNNLFSKKEYSLNFSSKVNKNLEKNISNKNITKNKELNKVSSKDITKNINNDDVMKAWGVK